MLLVSDGESNYDGVEELVDRAVSASITISAIGIGDADPNLLAIITNHGRGRQHMLADPRDLAKVAVEDVASVRASARASRR